MGVADRPLRIVVVGDELTAGTGDPKGLGWVGRVAARTVAPVTPMFLTLPMPGESTAGLGARWEGEAARRWASDADNRLVVGLGRADVAAGDGQLPGQAGYGLIAWLVLHTGWHTWLGLPEDL